MVFLGQLAVVVPTKGFDFFENINIGKVIQEFSNELSIEGKLKGVSRKFVSEIEKDIGRDRVDASRQSVCGDRGLSVWY
jgi:hypothetical protein